MPLQTKSSGFFVLQAFESSNSISVDAKGRIAIPSEYRAVLREHAQNKLHITRHPLEKCLLVFPEPNWEKFRTLALSWPQSSWERRRVLNNARLYVLDDNARILLTPELREGAQLEKGHEALLVGNGSHFELWDKALYNALDAADAASDAPSPVRDFLLSQSF